MCRFYGSPARLFHGTSHVASQTVAASLKQYEFGLRFADRDYYDRHLIFDHVVGMEQADQRQRFEAIARSIRDLLTPRWLLTQSTHDQALLTHGHHYMNLADLTSYVPTQERIATLYRDDHSAWVRKATLNVAGSGRFSSGRTIREYAREIWNAPACPIR